MNENERIDAHDGSCRDPRDNCPIENSVLRSEWRQKTSTIAVLASTLEQQTARFERLRTAAAALLDDMGDPEDGVQANLMQAVRDSL